MTKQVGGKQVIFLLWHEVDKKAVSEYSLALADKLALKTSEVGLHEIVRQIAEVVRETASLT